MYKYAIIDITEGLKIVRSFENKEVAKNTIYGLRKERYIEEHPKRPGDEHDLLKIDNGYSLVKYQVIG